ASKDGDETITVTNSYETKKIDVEVNKTWDDADDQDGKRADVGATIQLYANGKAVGNPVEVGAEDDWSKEWENLPVYENGKKIEYSVVETLPDGSVYETTPVAPQTAEEDTDISFAVTNKHEPEPTEVTVEKKWAGDEEWADEVRPDSIKVTLYANGEKAVDMDGKAVAPAVITAADKWTYTFTNVPKYNAGKEITYTVKEDAVAGYDTTYSEDTLTITNTYHPTPVDASFDVTKDMAIPEGLTGPEDWSYTFTAEAQDNAPAAETMTGTATKAEPTVTFGDITFEMPGEYQYIVTESGEVDGVTNDEAAETGKLVKIIVTGDKSGNLTAEVVGADGEGDATTFTNSYAVEPVTVDPPVRKELTGADIAKYEGKFKFKIEGESAPKGVDEIPMPKHETISNSDKYAIDVEGETYYEFGEIEYTMPGEYTYKISEVSGKVPGVTYDKTEYTLTVTVTDNGDGTLSAVMDPEAGDMVFTNEYKAKPVKLEIEATKVLKGRELKAGEFTFQLKDGDKVVAEGTNDANGKIVFDELTFKKAGTYTYSMLEVIGDEKNMKYDTDVHTVTVEVTDEGIGQLKAVCEDEITFTNTYKEKPKKPEPTPKTGDDSMDSVAILGLFASAALLGLLRARRRSDER
ncbi:MAG: Cna B-type domain-containing protein, partial [Clostridiales bacterium]|nr:Cna B-type domain-containing protein [Clostridiales bacterium]